MVAVKTLLGRRDSERYQTFLAISRCWGNLNNSVPMQWKRGLVLQVLYKLVFILFVMALGTQTVSNTAGAAMLPSVCAPHMQCYRRSVHRTCNVTYGLCTAHAMLPTVCAPHMQCYRRSVHRTCNVTDGLCTAHAMLPTVCAPHMQCYRRSVHRTCNVTVGLCTAHAMLPSVCAPHMQCYRRSVHLVQSQIKYIKISIS